MATSADFASQRPLTDEAKELLLERYLDLEFVDDVTELSCKRCGRVVIHHYVANCEHLFCRNCKRILSINGQWKNQCPLCSEYITNIARQEVEVERRVNELMSHCPNHKYGCKIIAKLQHIPEHLAVCDETREANLPVLLDETDSIVDIRIRLAEVSQQLNRLSQRCDQMQQTSDHSNQQMQHKLDQMEQVMINKLGKAEEQQIQMKAILIQKIEELDQSRRADFKLNLDQLSQKIDNISTILEENRTQIEKNKNKYQSYTGEISKTTAKASPTKCRKDEYNILLLGPRWSGKSTFINSLANYLQYETIDEAMSGQLQCLIPGKISFKDQNNEEKTVSFGAHDENLHPLHQSCQCYELNYNGDVIRLIECPGTDDEPREQLLRNWHDVMETIKSYEILNAICIVMKPYETALLYELIKECLRFVLSHLDQSAVDNLIFIVTCSNQDPAMDTESTIKKCLTEITKMTICIDENHFYRMDNCGFRCLIMKSSGEIIKEDEHRDVWTQSVSECRRLLHYIINGPDGNGLKPHLTNNTINVNEAYQLGNIISHLPQQIDEKVGEDEKYVAILIKNKEAVSNYIKSQKDLIVKCSNQINDLTKDVYICQSDACRLDIVINSTVKTHYLHWCENVNYILPNLRPCTDCHCPFDKHEKVDAKTRAVQLNAFITDIESTVEKAELEEHSMERLITQVQAEQKQLTSENNIISSAVLDLNRYYQSHVLLQPNDQQDNQSNDNTTNQQHRTVNNIKQQLFQLKIHGTEIRNAYIDKSV